VPNGTTAGAPYSYAFSAIRLSEYATGNPPVIAVLQRDGMSVKLAFATESNRVYAVEYKQQLQDVFWQTLTNVFGTGSTALASDSPAPTRFYRVRVQ
jgi:hypothetical protein